MGKVIPLVLVIGWLGAGCTTMYDDFRDPYASRIDVGYYYGLPYYQQPYAYYHRCYGVYGPSGGCIYYRPPYVPLPGNVPHEDPVIPLTQPPIMAIDGASTLWRAPASRRSDPRVVTDRPGTRSTETRATGQPTRGYSSQRNRSAPPPRSNSRPVAPRSAPKPSHRPRARSPRPDP